MSSRILLLCLLFVLLCRSSIIAAPTYITFSGELRNTSNKLLANGTYQLKFKFYVSATTTTAGWSSPAMSVKVSSGTYTVTVSSIPAQVWSGSNTWVEAVCVTPSIMTTRMMISTTATQPIVGATNGWLLTGNSGTRSTVNFIGTTDNQALELRAYNARAIRIEPHCYTPTIIAGYSGNTASVNAVGSTIAGGGTYTQPNTILGSFSFIGAGYENTSSGLADFLGGGISNTTDGEASAVVGGGTNTASGDYSFVGGGENNTASGDNSTVVGGHDNTVSGHNSTVVGGHDNSASGEMSAVLGGRNNNANGPASTIGGGVINTADGSASTVSGGNNNHASGADSTVSGGVNNIASGEYSTAGGGIGNTASGTSSFAAGCRANANHNGTFVWSDLNPFDFASTAANQFDVRCTGGSFFVSAIDGTGVATAGVSLAAGGNSWSAISDRNLKANFAKIDSREVLRKLADLDVTTWNMKSQDPSIRHIGPMAQDFAAAFKVGEDDRHISMTDADGVALAAIKGLNDVVREQQTQIEELMKKNASLEQRLSAIEKRINDLEKRTR